MGFRLKYNFTLSNHCILKTVISVLIYLCQISNHFDEYLLFNSFPSI